MFRLLRSRVPLVSAVSSLARFQSSSVVGEVNGVTATTPNNQSRRPGFVPTRLLPRFEIHDVRDVAAQGSMTRVSVDGKQLLVSQFPQLGPRKADPNDTTTPQFDRDRRISLRFRHMDMAAFVAVVEGRLPSHRVKNNAFELGFEKMANGYELKGQVHRSGSQVQEEWGVRFENQFAVTMEHFLKSALMESFGFAAHQNAAEQQQQQQRQGQAQGQQNNNRRRNNNRNNRDNNTNDNAAASGRKARADSN